MRLLIIFAFLISALASSSAQTLVSQVKTEQATVRFVPEAAVVVPGQTFWVAFEFELLEHWHVYWENPGASGLAMDLEWTLPEGFTAGDIQWPVPERILLGDLVNYGYEDAVTFLVPITVADSVATEGSVKIAVDAFWLICEEVCLPGEGSFELEIPLGEASVPGSEAAVFANARASMPSDVLPWNLGAVTLDDDLVLRLASLADGENLPDTLYFYASETGVTDPNAAQNWRILEDSTAELRIPLEQTFLDAPTTQVRGVLQSAGSSWAVSVDLGSGLASLEAGKPLIIGASEDGGFEAYLLNVGLPGWLLLAFLGGVILNVMPCVLPVLSLKVFSLLKHSGQTKGQALLHGLAYTAGVVVSFLLLAGLLIALRALGERIGWGFQLQSPGFIVVLALIFFLFALNLMGVFELGSSLVGADSGIAKRNDVAGSFGMGVLAAVVGAPCVGPLLAGVGGIAVQAPPATGLLIFGTMGFGLAAPFLFLAVFPKLVTYLPKPGAWMESVKQFMGFMLLAAVIFLLSVAAAGGGSVAVIALLICLFLAAMAAWIYGRWAAPVKSRKSRLVATILGLLILVGSGWYGVQEVRAAYVSVASSKGAEAEGSWGVWSPSRVDATLAEGNPVFVDFTASWCLICQVNKRVALKTEATEALFESRGIVALEADWSQYDPEITTALEQFGRSGVPLYLLYSPDGSVQVLPQSLTNGIIAEAVDKVNN